MKNGFIKGEAMRLLRANSSKKTFEESLVKFKQHLRISGYPKTVIERSLSGINFADRPAAYVPPSSEQHPTNTDGTMESNTKSAFVENHLFETSDNMVQKR